MNTPLHLANILWHSNATWVPSGYGTQTNTWLPRLKALGYDPVVSAFFGLDGAGSAPLGDKHGIVHLPRSNDVLCNDIINGHFSWARTYYPNHGYPDIVFSLVDPFSMHPAEWENLPWAAWTPVDSDPLMQELRVPLEVAHWPVAMSRFGEARMKEAGLDPLYVPHGVDSELYRPIDRTRARRILGEGLAMRLIGEEVFLVVAVGLNGTSTRKNFNGILEAFALFHHEYPNSLMYMHAEPLGLKGAPLESMAAQLGIGDSVLFPPSYAMTCGTVTEEMMNHVYNAADVKIQLSKGEGFGLTDLEAQLTGTPVITTNFSASIEINFTGWLVDGPLYSDIPLTRWKLADSYQAAKCLESAYEIWRDGDMPSLRARTRDKAIAYDVNNVMHTYMLPALETMLDEAQRGVSRAVKRP